MSVVTILEGGQVRIPEAVLDKLGVQPGMEVEIDAESVPGSIFLRPLFRESQLVNKGGVWVVRSASHPTPRGDVDWVAEDREERMAVLAGD